MNLRAKVTSAICTMVPERGHENIVSLCGNYWRSSYWDVVSIVVFWMNHIDCRGLGDGELSLALWKMFIQLEASVPQIRHH